MNRFTRVALTVLVVLAAWQALVYVTGVPRFILPGPGRVAMAFVESWALLAENAWVTAAEVLIGLAVGSLLGIATAVQLMMLRSGERWALPLMVLSQAIPVFALAPLLTLWFGYGLWSKVVMTTLIIYFPVAATFYDGLRRTDPGLLDLAWTLRARPTAVLLRVRFPAALPSLGSGLRLAATYAPIGAVIGEWVGASKGLGYLMLLANGRAKTDLMFAAVLLLALMTVLLHTAVSKFARRLAQYSGPGG
ncbi:MAG: ABC transporter permease [Gammaproteobacteria bacterium]